ncbi:DUF4350 domain-containing protein [Streptomyces sp. NPDC051219]|uniref:DUF4350 domain-containing protein n=1 Tax=Streptomyces sp. NPDC051219 TaxID=3155283 RepID=UPI00341C34DD
MTEATTTPSTSISPTPRQIWTRSRGLLAGLAVLLLAGIVLAAVDFSNKHGALDPRSADRYGSRAVAELLADRGVTTRVVTTTDEAVAAAGPDTTLLVTTPDRLTTHQQETLRAATETSGGRTVLIEPGPPSLGVLAPGVRAEGPATGSALEPDCALPAATRAGKAETGGLRYTADNAADACYPSAGRPTLLRLTAGNSGDTVVLGSPESLLNHRLDDQGNASLALQLLGSRAELVWYMPSLADPSATGTGDGSGADRSFLDLIPSGWLWGLLQLTFAAVLAALWRARRLGPLVTERLPVAIRASESTEGRARLYRKAGARDRAAEVLRAATRNRLALVLGVPPTRAHAPEALLPAVSARVPDPSRDLSTLLFGPAPADDTALITLTDQLDALEREVRTS